MGNIEFDWENPDCQSIYVDFNAKVVLVKLLVIFKKFLKRN